MSEPMMRFDAVVRRQHFAELSGVASKRFGGVKVPLAISLGFIALTFTATLGLVRLSDEVARPLDRTALIGPAEVVVMALLVGMAITLALIALVSRAVRATYGRDALRDGGSYLGHRTFALEDAGIRIVGAHGEMLTRWSAITDVSETPQTLLLWTDPGAAIMVPKDAFADDAARAEFRRMVEAQLAAVVRVAN